MRVSEQLEAVQRHDLTDFDSIRLLVDASPGYLALEFRAGRNGAVTKQGLEQLALCLSISGTARFRDHDSSDYTARAKGDISIFRPNLPLNHAWTGSWQSFCLLIGPGLGEEILGPRWKEVVAPNERRSVIGDAPLIHAMTALYLDGTAGMPAGTLFQDCLVNAIVAHVGDILAGGGHRDNEHGLHDTQLSRVVAFLEANIGERLSLATIAGVIGVAPTKFCHLFKASTGMSPYQFLLDRRIRRAQRMLGAPDANLSDLALSLGFYDQSQFTRAFRRRVGMSPGKYRSVAQSRPRN